MNVFKITTYTFILLGVCLGPLFLDDVMASEGTAKESQALTIEESGELYLPSENALADLAAVIDTAKETGKLVLVVMGSNWCHDSRGLAARLYEEPLRSLVREYYETIFVDVGYLDKGKDVINSLGVSVYYATPTVLIIDPLSGQLVNAHNRHLWADAYSISMDDSVDYFRQMSQTDLTALRAGGVNGEQAAIMAEIDAFERRQADRLYAAYGVLGPMLKEFKEGDAELFSEEAWNEVRDFRYKVPADVDALRAEAIEQMATGQTDIILNYPEYTPFSWEVEGQ
jgi:hypothetical protein